MPDFPPTVRIPGGSRSAPYAAVLDDRCWLQAPPIAAYDLGRGDFTIEAWVRVVRPGGVGTVLARKGPESGEGNGGFLLVIKPDGVVTLATDDGFGFFLIDTAATPVTDGDWHHLAAVRQEASFTVYVDGLAVPGTTHGTRDGPLNVNNRQPLTIGTTYQRERYRHFAGRLGVVVLWRVARTPDQVVSDLRSGGPSGLDVIGSWTFDDRDGADSSQYHNAAQPHGSIRYVSPGAPLAGSDVAVDLSAGGWFVAPRDMAYQFGTGPFTVAAWIRTANTDGVGLAGGSGTVPLALFVATAHAQDGLAMDLTTPIVAATGISATEAAAALARIGGQAATGVAVALAQQGRLVSPDAEINVLVNGAATDGLSGWTIIDNGGDGWSVQQGYGDAIGFPHVFAVSDKWCRKSQTVDLVARGLTPAYLDTGPRIVVTDWIAALAPEPPDPPAQSEYSLVVRLLDEAREVVKEIRTGPVAVPPGPDPAIPAWTRVQHTLERYGPGIRYVALTDGGVNPAGWGPAFGLKLTGTSVGVLLAPPTGGPQLLRNSSGQDGMAGWTDISPVGQPWQVLSGAGTACPASVGTCAFAVSQGSGVMDQTIDLVAAGYRPEYLDTAPTVQVGCWVASVPDRACDYHLTATLLDENGEPLHTLASGDVQVPAGSRGFRPLRQAIVGYPAGVRAARLVLGAKPAAATPPVAGEAAAAQPPALVTGALVTVAPPPEPEPETEAVAGLGEWQRVQLTDSYPYWWVCRLRAFGSGSRWSGSGWIVRVGSKLLVVTAAHVMFQRSQTPWATSIDIQPAAGGNNPYDKYEAVRAQLQLPIEYLLVQQAAPSKELFDYAAIVVNTPINWHEGGFRPVAETDSQLREQQATITGFPGNPPFQHWQMYTEDLSTAPENETQVYVPSAFTYGASGGPVYVAETADVTCLMSGARWFGFVGPFGTRITPAVIENLTRWATPLTIDDQVCTLQVVIHTGAEPGAGTSDTAEITMARHSYPINPLWMPESGSWLRMRGVDHFDGYDLSAVLRDDHPQGLRLADLIDTRYRLTLTGEPWYGSPWYVDSVTFFVNGRRLFTHEHKTWLGHDPPQKLSLEGTISG